MQLVFDEQLSAYSKMSDALQKYCYKTSRWNDTGYV